MRALSGAGWGGGVGRWEGKITFANLKRVAKELGENMTDEELQSMLAHADHSGNGAVSMDDFYRLMKKGGGKKNKSDDLLDDD